MTDESRFGALEALTGRWLKQGFDLLQGGGLFLRKVTSVPTQLPDGRIWHKGSSLFARLNGVTETLATLSAVSALYRLISTSPATRYVDLQWDDIGTATKASDTHGSIGGFGTHLDFGAGTDYTVQFQPVTSPADFSSTAKLQLWLSTPATAGSYKLDPDLREPAIGATGLTTSYAAAAVTSATSATANIMELIEFSFDALGAPVAGRVLLVALQVLNASDTLNVATVAQGCTLWKARIAYTPTL